MTTAVPKQRMKPPPRRSVLEPVYGSTDGILPSMGSVGDSSTR
ncbi:hypothetical protein [Nonomuraea sp. NPDC049709]